jgi:hypothetical protein
MLTPNTAGLMIMVTSVSWKLNTIRFACLLESPWLILERTSFFVILLGFLLIFGFGLSAESLVTLFDESLGESGLEGKGNNGLGTLSNDNTVILSGAERVVVGVLNVGNVVRTVVDFDVLEDTDATDIVSSSDEDTGTVLELEAGIDVTGGEVELDGVVDVDLGVGVTDGSTVVGHDVWDVVLTDALLLDLAEFELGLGGRDLDSLESSLNVVKDSEGFGGLGDGDDVHEAEGESVVSADFVVHSDVSVVLVSADLEALNAGESVLQSVSEEDREGDALSHLVGTSGRSGSVNSTEFSKVPVLGSEHALHVLFRSSGHC